MRRLLFVLFLTGCGFLSKSAPPKLYSLDRVPPAAPLPARPPALPVGIDNVELPPGVDRRELVVRQPDNRLEVRSNEQWSAPFRDLVLHTLAFDLADRLPEGMVVLPGQPKPNAMRSMSIAFDELAAGPDKLFVLDARWTLGDVTHHERITQQLQSLDSPVLVTATSQALATLADRIAGALSAR